MPSLIYFIVSAHIRAEVARWDEDDRRFKGEILDGVRGGLRGADAEGESARAPDEAGAEGGDAILQRKLVELRLLQQKRSEIGIQYNRIRFSPLFIAYTSKPLWPLLDLFAQYSNILVYLLVLLLTMGWWLNLANCLQMLLFAVFIFRVGRRTRALRLAMKEASPSRPAAGDHLSERQGLHESVQDVDLMSFKDKFDAGLRMLMHEERLRCWRVHYFTITLVLIVIYPSEFISLFREVAIEKGDVQVQTQLRTVIYYMFLSGVYHQPSSEAGAARVEEPTTTPYGGGTSGYVAILFLCILEKVCLSWLENRFGCDEEAYGTIDHF